MGHKNMKSRINLNGSRNIKMIFRRRQGRLVDYFLSSSCLFRMVYYVEYMLEKDNGEVSEDVGVKGPCIAYLSSHFFSQKLLEYDWSIPRRISKGCHPLSVISIVPLFSFF